MDNRRLRILLGDLGILAVAFIWGTTNTVIRDALNGITPLWFCALRFTVASAVVMALFGRRALSLPHKTKLSGVMTGTTFICAYLLGAVALLYTTAGNESFIISMSVVFVPVSVWFFSRKFPGWHIIAAVAFCTMGMAGLMLDDAFSVNVGDALCFAAMLSVTMYILLVQKYVQGTDPYGLVCWQALGGLCLALITALALEPVPIAISSKAWIAVIYTGTVGFALTLVIQNVAQKYTTATHAAILLSTAGVFGRAAGIIFIGEPMTWKIFIASALILTGVMIAEVVPAAKNVYAKTEKEELQERSENCPI